MSCTPWCVIGVSWLIHGLLCHSRSSRHCQDSTSWAPRFGVQSFSHRSRCLSRRSVDSLPPASCSTPCHHGNFLSTSVVHLITYSRHGCLVSFFAASSSAGSSSSWIPCLSLFLFPRVRDLVSLSSGSTVLLFSLHYFARLSVSRFS